MKIIGRNKFERWEEKKYAEMRDICVPASSFWTVRRPFPDLRRHFFTLAVFNSLSLSNIQKSEENR